MRSHGAAKSLNKNSAEQFVAELIAAVRTSACMSRPMAAHCCSG